MFFRLLLYAVGLLLAIASRTNKHVQAQLARDLSIVIASEDGVTRSYIVRQRRVSSRSGVASAADCVATFPTAAIGARIFLANDAIKQLTHLIAARKVIVSGNPALILWFYEMTMALLPWRRHEELVLPDRYIAHDPHSKVATRITREPAQASLDERWAGAVRQREKLLLWRVGKGDPIWGKIKHFNYLVDIPNNDGEPS